MESVIRRFTRAFLRSFFKHLYTTFAWAYDFVAWFTSMGQWQTWQSAALKDLPPGDLVELGPGPGQLLLKLLRSERNVLGIDVSPQMARLATRRLKRFDLPLVVSIAKAQRLPLPSERFSSVISTFPSEYIFDPDTIAEVWRVLQPGGVLIIVGVSQITGKSIPDRFAAWLYRITGQSGEPGDEWISPFERQGFSTDLDRVRQPRAIVLRAVARKDEASVFASSDSQA